MWYRATSVRQADTLIQTFMHTFSRLCPINAGLVPFVLKFLKHWSPIDNVRSFGAFPASASAARLDHIANEV